MALHLQNPAAGRSEIWQHIKTGGLYTILGEALIEDGPIPATIYRSLRDGQVWARPTAEFMDGRFRNLAVDEVAYVTPQDDDAPEAIGSCEECGKPIIPGDKYNPGLDGVMLCDAHAPYMSDFVAQAKEALIAGELGAFAEAYDSIGDLYAAVMKAVSEIAVMGDHKITVIAV